ncbi:MAG: hypothetical protein LC704_09660 [Actinobacteria bacterium]|nr:hypothetical protein [Actinomycetota bacterium]
MNGRVSHRRNARSIKAFSLLYLALTAASLLLVHGTSYEPAVSFILLYLVVSVGVTAAVALPGWLLWGSRASSRSPSPEIFLT